MGLHSHISARSSRLSLSDCPHPPVPCLNFHLYCSCSTSFASNKHERGLRAFVGLTISRISVLPCALYRVCYKSHDSDVREVRCRFRRYLLRTRIPRKGIQLGVKTRITTRERDTAGTVFLHGWVRICPGLPDHECKFKWRSPLNLLTRFEVAAGVSEAGR